MTFIASIAADELLSWESQVCQYPTKGRPGISYFPGQTPLGIVDCLLMRDLAGDVVGILNHYGFDSVWERTGNVNVWVRPDRQRKGIGRLLVAEANQRWPINLDQQRFTPDGVKFAETLTRDGNL